MLPRAASRERQGYYGPLNRRRHGHDRTGSSRPWPSTQGQWWAGKDSNLHPVGYEPTALPLSYRPAAAIMRPAAPGGHSSGGCERPSSAPVTFRLMASAARRRPQNPAGPGWVLGGLRAEVPQLDGQAVGRDALLLQQLPCDVVR